MKIGVFGNCQSNGMADSLRALLPDATIFRIGIREALDAKTGDIAGYMDQFSACDFVFMQPSMKHNVVGLQVSDFETHCKQVVPYPLIASRAFHPDCHYLIGDDGKQLVGPMGQYQSAIAAGAYLSGLSVERATKLFNTFTYRSLGYLGIDPSTEIIAAEAERLGYDFSRFIVKGGEVFMHTINHPKIAIIMETARQGLEKLQIGYDENAVTPLDLLAKNTQWPIYPGITAGVKPSDEIVFRLPAKRLEMGLEDFIRGSYEAFDAAGGKFNSKQSERAAKFIRDFVV